MRKLGLFSVFLVFWKQSLLLALLGGLLLFSLITLFWWVDEFAVLSLIPYDTIVPESRPSLDTWQRQLNGFFEGTPIRHMPAWVIVGLSLVFLIIALRRARKTFVSIARLITGFALTNILVLILMMMSSYIVSDLPIELSLLEPRNSWPFGYGRTFKFILADTVLLTLWGAAQAWGIPRYNDWASSRRLERGIASNGRQLH